MNGFLVFQFLDTRLVLAVGKSTVRAGYLDTKSYFGVSLFLFFSSFCFPFYFVQITTTPPLAISVVDDYPLYLLMYAVCLRCRKTFIDLARLGGSDIIIEMAADHWRCAVEAETEVIYTPGYRVILSASALP